MNVNSWRYLLLPFLPCLIACSSMRTGPETNPGVEIKLPKALSLPKMEFSSLEWIGEDLLLMPQYPETLGHVMYTVSRESLHKSVQTGQQIDGYKTLAVVGLLAVKKKVGPTYEGFEAAVFVKGELFLTLEPSNITPFCYLLRARIENDTIRLDTNAMIRVPKLKRVPNAGYEAMTYSKRKDKLLLFFEYNKRDAPPRVLAYDRSLKLPADTLLMDPLMYRLTDVTTYKGRMYGINYHYHNSRTETPVYVGADSVFMEPALQGKKLTEASFARIIELKGNNKIRHATVRMIGIGNDNWEGIVGFEKGFLLVTDMYSRTMLRYVAQ